VAGPGALGGPVGSLAGMPRPFALVTGASSGIGAGFARQLARGHDLVLVARDETRLRATAADLRDRWGSSVEVLPADLGTGEGVAAVESRLADAERPIDLLVNNAGFGTYGLFAELPPDEEEREIRVNVTAVVRLTRAVLPGMLGRGRGSVVIVSSIGAFQPGPRCATYVATKAFLLSFTESIAEELRGTRVRAMALCPGFTRTEFQERSGLHATVLPERVWMTADEVVTAGLADLARGRVLSVPGAPNKVVVSSLRFLPRSAVRRISGLVTSRL